MKPIVPAGRVVGLDAARALALLGMMATHILVGVDADGVTLPQQIAGGRASALFAVLAEVSLALMTGGTTPREDAAGSCCRPAWRSARCSWRWSGCCSARSTPASR